MSENNNQNKMSIDEIIRRAQQIREEAERQLPEKTAAIETAHRNFQRAWDALHERLRPKFATSFFENVHLAQ
mgnify:CR=1 FL=1